MKGKGGTGTVRSMATVFLLLTVPSSLLYAATQHEPLPVEEAVGALAFYPPIAPIRISPDGQMVAYTLQDARKRKLIESERYEIVRPTGAARWIAGDVCVTEIATGKSIQLGSGTGVSWGPSWSPNSEYLAFHSDREGQVHTYLWNRRTGQTSTLSSVISRGSELEEISWTPDGRQVLDKVMPENMTVEDIATLTSVSLNAADNASRFPGSTVSIYKSFSASPSDSTDRWDNQFLGDLALIEVATGNVRRIAKSVK